MFMKIDANSDGGVDWDEFTNWMLKMEAGAHSMTEDEVLGDLAPTSEQVGEDLTLHRGMVNKIITLKFPGQVYVTAGRDGTMRFWNSGNLEHIKTVSLLESNLQFMKAHQHRKCTPGAKSLIAKAATMRSGCKKLWITDIVVMSLSNRLAVSAADRSISFFDSYTMEVACRVRNLPHIPTSMAYQVNPSGTAQYLVYGDDRGCMHVFKIRSNFNFDEGLDEAGNNR